MATVNETGVQPVSLAEYKTLLETRFREEFDSTLAVDPETPVGQIISVAALMLTEADENLVELANSFSVSHAADSQIDDLASLLHIARKGATRSVVTATCAGVAGTVIPAASRARTPDGAQFESAAEATIATTGVVNVIFNAVESGEIKAEAGQLSRIVTVVSGWETITNAAAATVGRAAEPDFEFRQRYRLETARNACSSHDALLAAISEVAGVTRVKIEENDTSSAVTRQTVQIAARGIMVIAQGGTNAAVATAVAEHKPLGVAMSGDTTDASTSGRFQRVNEVAIKVAVTISVDHNFQADGITQIKQNLVDYANGRFVGMTGQFETDGFQIGIGIDTNRLRVPVYAVPGHTVSALTVVAAADDSALPAITPLHRLYTLVAENVAVTVST